MWIFKPGIMASTLVGLILTSSSDPQNYQHWQKLDKVCEQRCPVDGKPVTYGINEFVEGKNGSCFKICKWSLIPYWSNSRG